MKLTGIWRFEITSEMGDLGNRLSRRIAADSLSAALKKLLDTGNPVPLEREIQSVHFEGEVEL